jgi:hypothetical protein
MMPPRCAPALLLAGLSLCGCGESKKDPPPDAEAPFTLADGAVPAPEVQLGYYYEKEYDPFEEGDDCPVFNALQGGTWTMPAVRLRGIASPAQLVASLVTVDGEVLGEIDQRHAFSSQIQEGWVEIKRLPIPATHALPNEDDPIDDLFGQRATLTLSATDEDDNSAMDSVEVVIADNQIL